MIIFYSKNLDIIFIERAKRNKEEIAYVNKINEFLVELNYKVIGGVGKELIKKSEYKVNSLG